MAMLLCWESRSPVVELCPAGVREMYDGRRYRGLEGTWGPFLEVTRCPGVGPETLSLLGVVYELNGVLGVLTACDTSETVGHVSRSLRLAKS